MSLEIERRFRIHSVTEAKDRLAKQGITPNGQQHLIDEWFIPEAIHNREQHDHWFDVERGIAYRIRRIEQPDGTFAVEHDFKQLTEAKNHNTFHDGIILKDDYEASLRWLAERKYYNWLTIDKNRLLFSQPNPEFEVIIDSIEGLKPTLGFDSVIEIEYKGDEDREEALERIGTLAVLVGCRPEDTFEKSLTVAAMSVLAKFR